MEESGGLMGVQFGEPTDFHPFGERVYGDDDVLCPIWCSWAQAYYRVYAPILEWGRPFLSGEQERRPGELGSFLLPWQLTPAPLHTVSVHTFPEIASPK